MRLDLLLAKRYPDFSRSALQKYIRTVGVLVDGKLVKKSNTPMSGDEKIELIKPMDTMWEEQRQTTSPKVQMTQSVLYDGGKFLVINKPPYISTEDLVAGLCPVHRLDKDTSGVLVVARDPRMQSLLQRQWQKRLVKKEYVVLIRGVLPTTEGEIEAPIARSTRDRKKMTVSALKSSREAVTRYRVKQIFGTEYSLVLAYPLTGRTHQIRVHFASIGHPIIGDTTYGDSKTNTKFLKKFGLKRQFLHAHKLSITNPNTKKLQTFTAKLPDDLARVLEKLA